MNIEEHHADDIFKYRAGGAEAEFTRFTAKGEGIWCETRIRWLLEPYAGLLHGPARTNLLADRTLKSVAKHCSQQIPDGEWTEQQWWKFLATIRNRAISRFREGDPLIPLVEVEPDRQRWLLAPLLEYGGPTVIAAPGGAYKSLLALAVAVTVAGHYDPAWFPNRPRSIVPVAYLDWEADAGTFRNRVDALCHGTHVPASLFYRRERLPLTETADDLSRLLAKQDVGMVVVDSKGVAAGGQVLEADGVLRLFTAIRRLGVPALVVDHVTKRAKQGKEMSSPFGSVYTENVARQVWTGKEPADLSDGRQRVTWQLTKSNNGRRGQRLAWNVRIDTSEGVWERVVLESVDPGEEPLVEEGATMADTIAALLDVHGPLPVKELAGLLGKSDSTIRTHLMRSRDRFIRLEDGRVAVLPSGV